MYDNYVFDLYGTLMEVYTDENADRLWMTMCDCYSAFGAVYDWKGLKERFRQIETEETERMQRSIVGSDQRRMLVEPDLTRVFQELFREKGVACNWQMARQTATFFRILSRRSIRIYDGVKETLQELRRKGKGVYLLSNAQSDFTRPELEMLGLADCFDGILISSEEGCKKPCQAFFRRLLERYDLNPASCLMVGNDMESDIAGAANAGMDSLYIHTATSSHHEGRYKPTYCVMDGDWKKVADILLGRGGYAESQERNGCGK